MRNPLRTEAEAFRFLLLTLAAFAAIAVASILGGWEAGVPVFVVVTAATAWFYFRQGPVERAAATAGRETPSGERGVLVVANETLAGDALLDAVRSATSGRSARVLVVAPALTSAISHWASDVDPGRAKAQERLDRSLAALAALGVEATGEIGDSDPLQAVEDALREFGADEIILSTHPEGRSNWLERGVVAAARQRFSVPITHVVVDLEAEVGRSG